MIYFPLQIYVETVMFILQSRVVECQRRVHDLIDLQLCSAGVEAAIKAHDYETGIFI